MSMSKKGRGGTSRAKAAQKDAPRAAPATPADLDAAIEAETQTVGRELFANLERRSPSIFERRWWDDRILSWAMADESVKVQMFRFVDVLPMLHSHEAVTRHLQEYFDEVRSQLPLAVRLGLEISQPNSVLGKALALNARSNATRMSQRFIAGAKVEEVLAAVTKLRKQGFAFTLDLLGEATTSERDADAYQQSYLNLIEGMATEVQSWSEVPRLDRDHEGSIPRVNLSLKLSALYSQFRPIDVAGTAEYVKGRLRPLLRAAREHDAYIHVDMEQYAYKDLTFQIFKEILMEDEFRDFPDVGIVVQAYLPDAQKDTEDLLAWAEKRGTPIWIRLVKGAYWDYETIMAQARGWPVPVYQQKWESDANFERLTRFLMENYRWLRPALGSHNLRSLSHGIACAKHLGVPEGAFELQMLYGMGGDQAQLLADRGQRVRIYTPFGELIPGMAYLVRRLLENTSNDSFLRQSFTEQVSIEDLLMKPTDVAARNVASPRKAAAPAPAEPLRTFTNEPPTDFSRAEARRAMERAVKETAEQFGKDYPLVINGRAIDTVAKIKSINPSHKSQVVGVISSASGEEASLAIDAARRAFKQWSRIEVDHRAEYLELVAATMRNQRFELAAWQVHECGKPWIEADADVAEAIDFCMYYAEQARRMMSGHRCDLPGEENAYSYRPRGVAAIIAPWNFPLAILTGMTAAALVTGNTVIIKPAEQSSIVGYKLMEILQNIGIPDGVVNFLPGVGEEVGPELVGSPDVNLIAFTGSRSVGLAINHEASKPDDRQEFVKHVIAEMGGKNAIIVDDDADLDEAVLGVTYSAFGYAGQKCSACSRCIVLESVYDAFVEKLAQATTSLKVGPAELPDTSLGPVIDEDAFNRINDFIKHGKETFPVVAAGTVKASDGYYIAPHVFGDVDPASRLAREEIFGPVLAVIKVKDLDEAFDVANDSAYALTGGIFSRSPANLKRARHELQAGNLYLNRGITGALVERQPFGGFKLSGIGTKAGGPDYLLQFVIPINITENTFRRGFAPPADED
jgi:RHH-type proline utilization regulon transcriptional repressor/proline dehydrogenase/delta 1-pyrroline-5-carboxylate dehydrogenase